MCILLLLLLVDQLPDLSTTSLYLLMITFAALHRFVSQFLIPEIKGGKRA